MLSFDESDWKSRLNIVNRKNDNHVDKRIVMEE